MVTFDERGNISDRFNSTRFGTGMYGPRGTQHLDFESIHDVCELIAHHKHPNGRFSDDECSAWEIIVRTLGIDTSKWF